MTLTRQVGMRLANRIRSSGNHYPPLANAIADWYPYLNKSLPYSLFNAISGWVPIDGPWRGLRGPTSNTRTVFESSAQGLCLGLSGQAGNAILVR